MNEQRYRKRAATGAVLIGAGLGGFVDGIVLHQILQWHNMLSSVLPPEGMLAMRINMLWDGYFHAFVWILALTGVLLLWSTARRPYPLPATPWFVGLMLMGWGIFNLIEGIVDHHILNIHHVRGYGPDPAWDYGYLLAGGAGLTMAGWLIMRMGRDTYGDGGETVK